MRICASGAAADGKGGVVQNFFAVVVYCRCPELPTHAESRFRLCDDAGDPEKAGNKRRDGKAAHPASADV